MGALLECRRCSSALYGLPYSIGNGKRKIISICEIVGFDDDEIKLKEIFAFKQTGIINGKENNKNVRDVFQWVNTEFSLYDKENFIPGKIFKEQTTRIKNYPETVKLSDMTGIDNVETKEKLLEKWKY